MLLTFRQKDCDQVKGIWITYSKKIKKVITNKSCWEKTWLFFSLDQGNFKVK